MYLNFCGGYDEIPEGMDRYLNHYGPHFNKKLYEEAVSRMYKKSGSKKEYLTPMSKQEVDAVLQNYNIRLERGKLYDAAYVMMMCKADFYGKSVPNEECLAKYVKDVIDDADAIDGYVFNRFYADCMFMSDPIEWEDVI